MCGIAAILSPEPSPDVARCAGRMLELIAHRGPDHADVATFAGEAAVAADAPATIALPIAVTPRGYAARALPIPWTQALAGQTLHSQGVVVQGGALGMTHALDLLIGG